MLKGSEQAKYKVSVHSAFNHVRSELKAIGLLKPDNIFDNTTYFFGSNKEDRNVMAWAIFIEGNDPSILFPSKRTHKSKAFRLCLRDIFRHEFAHVLEHRFYDYFCGDFKDDFTKCFNAPISNRSPVGYTSWRKTLKADKEYKSAKKLCRTAAERKSLFMKYLMLNYVSEYATTNASEDFAETFMLWLKLGRDSSRMESRPGVYRKMLCIERAVCTLRYQC